MLVSQVPCSRAQVVLVVSPAYLEEGSLVVCAQLWPEPTETVLARVEYYGGLRTCKYLRNVNANVPQNR